MEYGSLRQSKDRKHFDAQWLRWVAQYLSGIGLIGVNLNCCRFKDRLGPLFFGDKGALFVPFSSRILAEALNRNKGMPFPGNTHDWHFYDSVYTNLGYTLVGHTAVLPPPPNPFAGGNRPLWAK